MQHVLYNSLISVIRQTTEEPRVIQKKEGRAQCNETCKRNGDAFIGGLETQKECSGVQRRQVQEDLEEALTAFPLLTVEE